MLRPMANLFAVGDLDPGFLDQVEAGIRASDQFEEIWRPATGWVAAAAPLPESEPDPQPARVRGFAFAEGRDRLETDADLKWLDRLEEILDRRPTSLDELPGDFGFVRIHPDNSATIVRSCGGLAPFYVRQHGGGFAVGTLLRYFTELLRGPHTLDGFVAATSLITSALIDGRTFLEGVKILPRASVTSLELPGRRQTETYWDPRPEAGVELVPNPERPQQLRRLLVDALERDLDPRGGNLLMLSGGVDSCSLGALVAGTMGKPLASISIVTPSEPAHSHELSYIEPLVQRFRIEPAHIFEITMEQHLAWARGYPPGPLPVTNAVVCELPRIDARHGVSVLLGGEFADEACGEIQRLTDWSRCTSLRGILRGRSQMPFGRRDRERWARRRLLDLVRRPLIRFPTELEPWVSPSISAEYKEWRRNRQRQHARDPRPLRELADRAYCDGWISHYWEGTTPLGIRRSIPFFTRECQELAFQCHPTELLGPGKKKLLRAALGKDVPARYLQRPDKAMTAANPLMRPFAVERDLPASVRQVVREEWQPRPPADTSYAQVVGLLRLIRLGDYYDGLNGRAVLSGA